MSFSLPQTRKGAKDRRTETLTQVITESGSEVRWLGEKKMHHTHKDVDGQADIGGSSPRSRCVSISPGPGQSRVQTGRDGLAFLGLRLQTFHSYSSAAVTQRSGGMNSFSEMQWEWEFICI